MLRKLCLVLVAALLTAVSTAALPGVGTATSEPFFGDGVNPDILTANPPVIGGTWTASVTLFQTYGASGAFSVKIRASTLNGPTFACPSGGRNTEFLIGGTFYATLGGGSHDGVMGSISAGIPNDCALVGVPWAAQATVIGGGFCGLTTAESGVVGN